MLRNDSFSLLRRPRFRRFLLARSISTFGNNLAPIALTFGVLEHSESPALLGIILACEIVPQALLTVFGGVLADRIPRGPLMVWANVVSFITQLALAAIFFIGNVNFVAVGLLAALGGASFAFFGPAAQGIIPQIVEREDIHEANGILRLFQNIARLAGPVAAGAIVAISGSGWAFALDALTFIIAAIALSALRDELPPRPPSTFLQDLRLGWGDFWSRTWLWAIVLQFAVINVAWGAGFQVLGPTLFETYGDGPTGWGVVLGAFACGIIVGAIVATKFQPKRPLLWAVNSSFVKALPLLFLAYSPTTFGVAIAALIAGIATEIFIVNFYATMQRQVPEDRLSRVSSYDILFGVALAPIGYILASPLVGLMGEHVLELACVWLVVLSTTLVLCVPSVRALRSEHQSSFMP